MKKIKNLIYVRNVDETFNKKEPIENMVEVNIHYQGHRKRMKIDVIGGQKLNVILGLVLPSPVALIKTKKSSGRQTS